MGRATTARGWLQRYGVEDRTGGGIECEEIAVQSSSEDQSGSRDRNTGDYRLGSFTTPSNHTGVGIDRGDPAFLALVFIAKRICRTQKLLAGFEDRSFRIEFYGAAPIDAIHENEVRFR